MQRIFAFDPGTSAIGWAVLDIGWEGIEIVGAGVRVFALARQKTVQKMRQRLK
jgi:CRISPR/Cas system Type II protein with McrA/HNH and RuvC-like nuclease domain